MKCAQFEHVNATAIVFDPAVSHAICKPPHSIVTIKVNDYGSWGELGGMQHKSSKRLEIGMIMVNALLMAVNIGKVT
jgi:hypothetical protein